MTLTLCSAITIILLAIAYQDFKDRAVYWWLYAILFLVLGSSVLLLKTFNLEVILINLSFLIVQYLGVIFYFSIKKRKLTLLLLEEIGLGDILYIFTIALFLPNLDFLLVYGVGLFSALIWFLTMILIKKQATIPLAGIFSLVQIILLWLSSSDIEFLTNL